MQSTSRTDEEQHVERVIVSVRLRPFTEDEYLRDRESCIETFDPNNKVIVVKKEFEKKIFNFDYLLDPQTQQNNVYGLVAQDVVEGVLRGYNGTIFAYGQTGTGKTHTMLGVPNDTHKQGIIPRALEHIFETAANDNKYNYEIRIAYLQIYMEILQDLIQPSNADIKIRESPESGVFITGNTWVSVKSVESCLDVLTNAEKNRTFAFTTLNATSSRSHAVFIVKLEKRLKLTIDQVETLEKQNSLTNTSIITSILYLVDLAGSERVKKSKISGERLEEAISINSSLTALGKCIHALTDPKTNYVPFRESKLTRILQDSLGGNAKTALIVNIGPSLKNLEETLSSLYFGSRAMKVKNRPFINKQKDYYALSMQLQGELDAKDDEINRMQIKLSDLLNEVNVMKSEYEKYKLMSESSDKLMKNLTKTYNTSNLKGIIDKIESTRQEEMEHLELRYKQILIEKDKQHKEFLEEIDQLMLEQENEINDLKQRNDHLQMHLENMENEKEYLKDVLESERNQFKGKNSVLEVEKNQLNLLIEQMRNHLNQDMDKEKDYVARILELEEKLQEKNNYNSKEKSLQSTATAYYNHEQEKENFSHREEELKKVIETLRAVISQKDTMLENEEKFKNLEIQNLKDKIQTLNNNLDTLKKEKNDFMNKDRQSALKIQDLEATIIKFGDEKNQAWDNLKENETFFKKEIADLKEKLALKDQGKSNEQNDRLKQTEEYYLQKIKNMQIQNEEKENELQARISELQVLIDDKQNNVQRVVSDFNFKENQASLEIKDLENQLHYKNQEFLNFEKRFHELSNLLKEKDAQINQLREFVGSQEGTLLEKGAKTTKRINELEEQLQQKNNDFYKLQDEMIRQEQILKLEIQKLKDENMLQLNESMEVKNREVSTKNMTDALKTEVEKIQKSNIELVQMLSKHQEESSTAKKQLSNSLLEKDREIDSLRALLSNHEIKTIQSTSQVTEVQGLRELERSRLMNRINDCEEQISLKDREISNLRKTIQQVEADIRNLRLEIQRKDEDYSNVSNQLQAFANESHQLKNIIQENHETLQSLQLEVQKKDDQYSDLLSQLQNITNENNSLKSELEEHKLIHQDALRNKEEDSEFLVKKLNSVQKEKEDLVNRYEEVLKARDQEILKLRNQAESFGPLTPIMPVANNQEINLLDEPPTRSSSVRELEMQLELQAMENETLKMVSEELKEENIKLKAMLRKHRPGELNEGDSFSLDDSRMRSSYFNGQSDLQELTEKDINEEQDQENSPSKKEENLKNKTNQLRKLQQSLENEIFQKEILLGEKETLITKIKELEAQMTANAGNTQPPKSTEGERMMNNFKRAERDREEYEQKIKELKKIIEMNQTQFANQLKNINSKHEKAIHELNDQITELKDMNDGLELQAADSAHAIELIAQKDQEIEHLNEEIKKLTQKAKETSQKLKDLENDLKNFNEDYEKLETENRNLMSIIEKSKYNVLEYSSQMQERDLLEQKLIQDLDEYKHSIELFEEKVVRLETELRRVSTKKMHLEFELKNQAEQYTQEVCQVVLENCLMAVQMQELNQDLKEVTGLQKMKTMFSNQVSLTPSRKWLQTVGQAYMKKNPVFSIQNFNTFLDNFSYFQGNLNDAYIQYEEVFSALGAPTQTSPEKRSPIKKRNEPVRKVDMGEVQSVIDNMLVVLEVQDEIENQIQLDLKWFGLDMYIEREIDRNLIRGSPAKTQLLLKPKYMTLTQTTKAVTDINTSYIFTSKYVKNLQAMIQNSQPTQETAANFIACDAKLLQKIMAINEGSINSSRSNNDLLVDMTTLFLNTYNYCSYIKQKNDFQEKLIKDLQGVVQTCIRYLTFKEVELKVSEKTRKVLLKRYLSLVKAFKADKKTFKEYSTQVQKREKMESAALIIQRFYRRFKQKQMQRYAFKTNFQLQRERKNSQNLSKNADDFNAKTGKLLIQQSMNHLNIVFNDMRDIFLQKTSLKYTKFKQHYNAIPKKNESS